MFSSRNQDTETRIPDYNNFIFVTSEEKGFRMKHIISKLKLILEVMLNMYKIIMFFVYILKGCE